MPRQRAIDLLFPVGGVNRRYAYQSQPPFTCVDAVNVCPEANPEKRLRGGTRPGILRAFSTQLPADPIRLLTVLRSVPDENRSVVTEDFSSGLSGAKWDAAADWGSIITVVGPGHGTCEAYARRVAILDKVGYCENINTDAVYSTELYLVSAGLPNSNRWEQQHISLWAYLDDDSPAYTSGVEGRIRIDHELGANKAEIRCAIFLDEVRQTEWFFSTHTPYTSSSHTLTDFWMQLIVEPTGIVRFVVQRAPGGNLPFSRMERIADLSSYAAAGQRVGIEYDNRPDDEGEYSGTPLCDNFALRYFDTTITPTIAEAAVAASGGDVWGAVSHTENQKLYHETTEGGLTEISLGTGATRRTVSGDKVMISEDRLGKLYIADYGVRVGQNGADEGNDLHVTDGVISGTNITSISVNDFDDFLIELKGDVIEIMASDLDAATPGVYKITSYSSGTLVIAGSPGDATGVEFRVCRAPKVFDPTVSDPDKLSIWFATDGSVPLNCSMIDVFRDRMMLAGDEDSPGVWFMSRVGDPLDWDYGGSATDRARAIAGTSATSDTGQLSIPLTAMVTLSEDYVVFSAHSEMYLLRGDPTVGGIMGNISRQIGIGSRTAFCRTPDGHLVFLSRDGFYRMHASRPLPEALSRDSIPADLLDIVGDTSKTISMEYDVRRNGIHLMITPNTAGLTTHYWYDWKHESFWPIIFADTDHDPMIMGYNARANRVLLGCRDGYIRQFSRGATVDDDGDQQEINSNIVLGPIRLGHAATYDGLITQVDCALDDESGDALLSLKVGDDAEGASNAAGREEKTFSAGYNGRIRCRARGQAGYVRIADSSGSSWTLDRLTIHTSEGGVHRKRG